SRPVRSICGLSRPVRAVSKPDPRFRYSRFAPYSSRVWSRFRYGRCATYSTHGVSEDSLGGTGLDVGGHVQAGELGSAQLRQALGDVEEALDLGRLERAVYEGAELLHVLRPREGPGTQRMRIRHRNLVDD